MGSYPPIRTARSLITVSYTHLLRVQRQLFRDSARELSREEYARLVETARRLGRGRLSLLMETICATGIRVSEVRYITAEAVREGRPEIALQGTIRTILLPGKLCRKLEKYARQKKITSGELFLTRSGRPMSRKQIWAEMKGVCRAAGVAPVSYTHLDVYKRQSPSSPRPPRSSTGSTAP